MRMSWDIFQLHLPRVHIYLTIISNSDLQYYNLDYHNNLDWKVLLEFSIPASGVGQSFLESPAQTEHFHWKSCCGLYSDNHLQVSDLADVLPVQADFPPHYYVHSKFPCRLNNSREKCTTVTNRDTFCQDEKKNHVKWVLPQRLWKAVQKRLRYQQGPDLMPFSIKISEPEGIGN